MFGFGKDHWEQSRQMFDRQFEVEGDRLLYRKSQKGAPIPVTEEERSRFVSEFVSRLRRGSWTIVVLIFIGLGLLIWLVPDADVGGWRLWLGMLVPVSAILALSIWAWGAPARELSRRSAVGAARSRRDVRRRQLSQLSYGQLATAGISGAIFPLLVSKEFDVLHGWGRLWLLYSAGIIAACAIQAFRKWRLEGEAS